MGELFSLHMFRLNDFYCRGKSFGNLVILSSFKKHILFHYKQMTFLYLLQYFWNKIVMTFIVTCLLHKPMVHMQVLKISSSCMFY
jgi:hypothetical protein